MVDEIDTGVTTPVETETTVTTPSDDQTTQATPEGESTPPADTAEDKYVPYSRFKEVNDRLRDIEEKYSKQEPSNREQEAVRRPETPPDPQAEAAKTILKQYGFLTADDVEQKIQQSKQDEAVQRELTRLEQKYDGKNGLPKFDRNKVVKFAIDNGLANPEVAYKHMFEPEWLNWNVQQAISKTKGVKTESSNGSGGQPAGPTNDDLLDAAKKGDSGAFDTILKRTAVYQNWFKK
jgi:hypothetical protein